jgi:hypothetical protein
VTLFELILLLKLGPISRSVFNPSGRSSVRSEKARPDLEPGELDVGLTVKLQQKLKETQQAKDKLEKKVEELEANLLKHKTQQSNVADTLKVNNLRNRLSIRALFFYLIKLSC